MLGEDEGDANLTERTPKQTNAVTWIVFDKTAHSRLDAVVASSRPEAIKLAPSKLRIPMERCDAAVVCEEESVEDAKRRVAGSVG